MALSKRAYGISQPFVDVPAEAVVQTSAPTSSDKNYDEGQGWVYKNGDTRTIYFYGGTDSSDDAVWILGGPGSSDVDTLSGDSGTATPSSGDITIAGGTNITTSASSSTVTLNLDAAITLATSVTSPLYTASGADTLIQADSNQDIVLKMGSADNMTKVSFTDSADSEVFSVLADGTVSTLSGLTVTGAFTQTAGAVSISEDNSANAVGIGNGTTARAIDIGSSAAAHTIAIGSATGAASLDLKAGTGNFTLDGAATTTYTIGASTTSGTISIGGTSQTGTFTLGGSDGAMTMNIANADGAKTINIGNGVDGNTISVGNGINTSAQTINIANGASGADTTLNIMSGTGTAGTGTLTLGGNTRITTIGLGDVAPAASRTTTIGGGTVVTASVTDTIDIGPDGATTNADSVKTVNVNTGGVTTGQVLTNIATGTITSGTHTVSIQTGNAAAGTVATNISTGTGTKTINVGNADANTTMNVDAVFLVNDSVNANTSINTGTSTGTVSLGNSAAGAISADTAAGISLDAATASNFTVTGAADLTLTSTAGSIPITAGEADAAAIALQAASGGLDIDTGLAIIGDAAGNIELNSSAGQILIGNDDVDQNASFATDGERTVTVGSTNGAAALVLQSGTGKITMTGTVQQIDANFLCPVGVCVPAFTMDSIAVTADNGGGVPTGTATNVNNIMIQGGYTFQAYVIGTQSILQPVMGANGLIISGDETASDGYEYNIPYLQYTIGTSAAFFFEIDLYINDRDGGAPYVFGFRKTEANNATFGNYTDYATIGMIAASSTTNVVTATELNAGGQTVTISTDAWGSDAAAHTLAVLVDASGNVTYTFDGGSLGGAAAFQFDNTDVVIPFIRIEQSANPTDVAIASMRLGFQA